VICRDSLIAVLVAAKGEGAVVVPDGILFGRGDPRAEALGCVREDDVGVGLCRTLARKVGEETALVCAGTHHTLHRAGDAFTFDQDHVQVDGTVLFRAL